MTTASTTPLTVPALVAVLARRLRAVRTAEEPTPERLAELVHERHDPEARTRAAWAIFRVTGWS